MQQNSVWARLERIGLVPQIVVGLLLGVLIGWLANGSAWAA